MKFLKPIFRYDRTDDERASSSMRFRANRKQTAAVLRNSRELVKGLIEDGIMRPYGCECSHCLSGWDCCGRLTVSYNEITRVKRGFVITQHLSYNV